MAKPVIVLLLQNGTPRESIEEAVESFKNKEICKEYHILFCGTENEETSVHFFNVENASESEIEEIKALVLDKVNGKPSERLG